VITSDGKKYRKCFLCMLSSYCEHNGGTLKNINFFIKEQFRPRILSLIRRAGGRGRGVGEGAGVVNLPLKQEKM
jgi:hypothetical protein